MGSSENFTSVDEPTRDSGFEQHSCFESIGEPVSEQQMCLRTSFDVADANVNDNRRLDGCLGLSTDDTTCSMSFVDTGIINKDGLTVERQSVEGVALEKVLEDECGVSRDCSSGRRSGFGVCNSPDRCSCLSRDGNNIFASSINESDTVAGSILAKSIDHEQETCLNESQSELDVCGTETNGLCLEKRGTKGGDLESFEHQEFRFDEVISKNSRISCDQRGKKKDGQGIDLSSLKAIVKRVEEENNVFAEVNVGNDNQILSSDPCQTPLESIPGTVFARNCAQQQGQKDNNTVNRLPGEEGVEPCRSFQFPSGLKPMTGSLRNCTESNDLEKEWSTSCPSVEGDMVVMEERTCALNGIEKLTRDQILPSQVFEIHSICLPHTGSPNAIHQEDQENDSNIACTSSKGEVESIEEKADALARMPKVSGSEISSEVISLFASPTNGVQLDDQENGDNDGSPSTTFQEVTEEKVGTCGEILFTEGCSMPPESIPSTDSPRNVTQQNEQQSDQFIYFPSLQEIMEGKNYGLARTETCGHMLSFQECELPSDSTPVAETQFITEEKRDFVGAIANDIGHPRSPSENIESPSEFACESGLPNSTQLNEQKVTDSMLEMKSDASAVEEINFSNCISASHDGEIHCKGSFVDDLLRTCEGSNSQMVHESISHPAMGTMEPKGNTDALILTFPMRSCQSSLGRLHTAHTLRTLSQKNDQGNCTGIGLLSAKSVTEDVEEKNDVSTDSKVEHCGQVRQLSAVEEILNEHSRVIEKPVSLQSCQLFPVDESVTCNRLPVTDLSEKGGFDALNSSNAVDCLDHGVRGDVGENCFSETIYPNNITSSSRRSSRLSRSCLKCQTKSVATDCRTTTKIQQSLGCVDIIFNVWRRKRSCLSKPARSSIWGLLGIITQFFGKSDMSSFHLAQNQGSQKARGGRRSRKRNKILAGGSSSMFSRNCSVSNRCLRLKVKVGKEICQSAPNVLVPEVVDTMGFDDMLVGDNNTESFHIEDCGSPKLHHEVEDRLGEEGAEREFQCLESNLVEVMKHPDDTLLDIHLSNPDFMTNLVMDKSAEDFAYVNSSHKGVEVLAGASENYVDPGTSPDSEVINVAPDSELRHGSQEGLDKIIITSSETVAAPAHVISSSRGKKKINLLFAGNCIPGGNLPIGTGMSKVKPSKRLRGRQKLKDASHSSDSPCTNAASNSLIGEEFHGEPLASSRQNEPGTFREAKVLSTKNRHALRKNSKSDGRKKGRSKISNSVKSERKAASLQEGNQQKSFNKKKVKEKVASAAKRKVKGVLEPVGEKTENQPQIGSHIADDIGRIDSGSNSLFADVANLELTPGSEPEQNCPPESAWVQCDDCFKWRRIQVSLAGLLDETCRWVCKDNMDTNFASCSIPQEKTNADINAEIGLSDYDEEDGLRTYNRSEHGLDCQSMPALPGSIFRRIDSNVFLHRSRKTQTIDEVMVCHCKSPLDGHLRCGDECLNRMLNIECVQGTCPCGDLCSNQQFQKRKYARMRWFQSGKKGYGLKSLEDIPKGKFIIEYVGEVLDTQAYEARQKEYAANGHKHFYFMTLNGSEVIDACAKGNLGRFINHSCDPNCRTEKWMVNGEICIGLFAVRDIEEGEELTFDYNYVRVFGAAAKKCHCGSPQCRGYIGGDPLNSEIIYQGDSDEEFPEPLMLEDGKSGDGFKTTSRNCCLYGDNAEISEAIAVDRCKMDNSTTAVGHLGINGKVDDAKNQPTPAISHLHRALEMEDSEEKYHSLQSVETSLNVEDETSIPIYSIQEEETIKRTSSYIPQVETSSLALTSGKLITDGSEAHRESRSDLVEDNQVSLKSRPRIKTSRKSVSVKKGKVNGGPFSGNNVKMMASKSQIVAIKPKKIMEGPSNGRFDAVQEKLNELLDTEGGISKRKDAPRGYLKLLLLTIACGGSGNGESIQSNRDLSMILDALLKTKSRAVLIDIINKNGLQMLHNMIKQYRMDFKKIPILRKLLKVLEYLAVRDILTRNHITAGPPCPGMASFRGSILSLTEHGDKQVHQIARSFRDRWIPKSFRNHSYTDRDDNGMDIHRGANCYMLPVLHHRRPDQDLRPSEAIDCVTQTLVTSTSVDTAANLTSSSPRTVGCQGNVSKTRKCKSRWDQPAEPNLGSIKHKEPLEARLLQSSEHISCPDHHIYNHLGKDVAVSTKNGGQITQEDVPPGFSSPFNPPLVSSDPWSITNLPQQNVSRLRSSLDVAIAHPLGKFNSRLPVSYGIPLHVLQQFGSQQRETVDGWVVAPGMPFHPFPPLPPLPRDKKETSPACTDNSHTVSGPAEEWQEYGNRRPNCCPDENNPSTSGSDQIDVDIHVADAQHTFKRMRGSSSSYDLGKRFFRQQKRKGPPWLWKRNEIRSSYSPQDVSFRVDKPVSNFYQRPPHENRH